MSSDLQILKESHRTRAEQLLGLGIFLLICIGFEIACGLSTQFYKTISDGVYASICTFYSISLAFSMWTLWRSRSLRVLKFELCVFLNQFFFQIMWSLSFFAFHQMLLSLVALLLLWSNTILTALLFWKKERISGSLLVFPALWNLYLIGLNMIICISNP